MARRPAPKKRGATSSRRPPRRREGFRLPGWLWGIAGLAAGFLLAQHQHGTAPWQEGHDSPLATVLPRPPASEPRDEAPPEASEPRMPTFEFYTLLPESEVVAPRGEVGSAPPPPPAAASEAPEDDPIAQVIAANLQGDASEAANGGEEASPVTTSSPSRYMLQAASFRESGDAEQLKQRLRNLSLVAQVSQVQASGGETWHRVQVGPYDDTRELNRAQDLMITQGIEPLLIRLQN
ncbi:SPOR domain-containing protein [Halomonas campisalis]|uniref:SPOR domain-containing protein n=1 Tax=Billgrantia campisalis TaxID=74661 RepID=A0ABS9P9C4_9GAMM|nr:SPOR domain-containing protein [Halomonas campisalis]MCG6658371.1 SPOR domain-containing protein [Halomonas campisalis]MDR5863042.1 SPOR domain-containing protein [Halomonas campisalis]